MLSKVYFLLAVFMATFIFGSQALTFQRYYREGKTITASREFSEERGSGSSGFLYSPISGMKCGGRYCDNKVVYTVRDNSVPLLPLITSTCETPGFSEEGAGSQKCPAEMLVSKMKCSGRYCDNISLECSRMTLGYRVISNDIKTTPWFSEETPKRDCPDGYYVVGMACKGRFCDNISLTCARVDCIPRYSVRNGRCRVLGNPTWFTTRTDWFSNEGSYSEVAPEPVVGIKCRGRHCNDKQLVYLKPSATLSVSFRTVRFTRKFSQEGAPNDNFANCPRGQVMTQLQCLGSYCDTLRIGCSVVGPYSYFTDSGDRKVVPYFSEVEGERKCPLGYYIDGISCRDKNCGSISLKCIRIKCR